MILCWPWHNARRWCTSYPRPPPATLVWRHALFLCEMPWKTPQLMLTSSCSVYDPRSRLSVPPYSSFLLSIFPDVFHEQSNNMRMNNSKSFRSSFQSNALLIQVYIVYHTYLSVSNSTSIQCNCYPFNIYYLFRLGWDIKIQVTFKWFSGYIRSNK